MAGLVGLCPDNENKSAGSSCCSPVGIKCLGTSELIKHWPERQGDSSAQHHALIVVFPTSCPLQTATGNRLALSLSGRGSCSWVITILRVCLAAGSKKTVLGGIFVIFSN